MTAPLVVLFDLDDTIMAHREAVEAGILLHMRRRGYEGDVAAAQRRWYELEEQHYHDYLAGRLSFEGQRRARASAFAESFGEALGDAEASAWFAEYFEGYRASWSMHDDALPVLDRLTEAVPDVRLRHHHERRARLPATKLERFAPRRAHRAGRAHPARWASRSPTSAIFEAALARFDDTPPERPCYVGDRLRTDAIGAAQAGLLGVWLNRRRDRAEAAEAEEARIFGVRQSAGSTIRADRDRTAPRHPLRPGSTHPTRPDPTRQAFGRQAGRRAATSAWRRGPGRVHPHAPGQPGSRRPHADGFTARRRRPSRATS